MMLTMMTMMMMMMVMAMMTVMILTMMNMKMKMMMMNLELTQSICEGRGVPRVSWKYFNKENIKRSFKFKN